MTLLFTPALWLVPLLMGITYTAYRLRSGRLSRHASRKANASLARTIQEAYTDSYNLTRAAVSQGMHDALSRRIRRWFSRAAQAMHALTEHDTRIERLSNEETGALGRRDEGIERQRLATEKAAYLGHRTVGVLNAILLVGDITIVSMAIQASESSAGLFVATAGALALATALFILGKLLGDSLKDTYDHRLAAGLVAIGIVMFSASLYSLRLGHVESWLGLATSPAIGAAGVALLGPSRLQSAVHRAEKAAAKIGKRREKAIKKRGKVAGRVEYMLTQAHLALTASGFATKSIGQLAGIADAVTAYETVANQLGITLGADWQHRPATTVDQPVEPVDAAEEGERSLPKDDRSRTPSNGEGTHEVDLTDAPVFVPDFDDAEKEPS